MTTRQRAKNREREVQQRAKLAAKIERFKKSAASVSTDRSDEKNVFTSYADREIKGLELRDYEQAYATVYSGYDERELHLRWFLNRPGHRPLDLGDDIDAPDEARRYARGLLDGREDAIVNAYIDTRLTSTSTTVGVLRRLSCYGTRRSKRSKWRLKTAAGS
jgi:hypothetical protein